jgi:uncharacterized membrane protein HdeD (DUF308 family)
MVKFDEKTLAAERRLMPWVLLVGIILLLAGVIAFVGTLNVATLIVLTLGLALFSSGFFWFVDRQFHSED